MSASKDRVTFILSHTQFASNLGAAARSMKNMGLEQLILIWPECEVGAEARTFAMKGAEILDRARFLSSLDDVAGEFDILVGTSSRFGSDSGKWITPRHLAEQILPGFPEARVGIAFGSERNGLTREEIRLCQWYLQIPTSTEYPVLNLAQAVGIVAYEIHFAVQGKAAAKTDAGAAGESLETLLESIAEAVDRLPLPGNVTVSRVMERIRKITLRARLETADVNLIRGLLARTGHGRTKDSQTVGRLDSRESDDESPVG